MLRKRCYSAEGREVPSRLLIRCSSQFVASELSTHSRDLPFNPFQGTRHSMLRPNESPRMQVNVRNAFVDGKSRKRERARRYLPRRPFQELLNSISLLANRLTPTNIACAAALADDGSCYGTSYFPLLLPSYFPFQAPTHRWHAAYHPLPVARRLPPTAYGTPPTACKPPS